MREYMGFIGYALSIAAYASAGIFIWRVLWRLMLWAGRTKPPSVDRKNTARALVLAAVDVAFLRRLFMANKGIWAGEWLFHLAFVLVVLRHMRFFFDPVPGWVFSVQRAGELAGYVLPASLLYILIYRFAVERAGYVSTYNLFLSLMILGAGSTGLLMRRAFRADVVAAKEFVQNWLGLSPSPAPESALFILHLALVLVVVPFLPTHIFTAPFTTLEARRREGGMSSLVHKEK
jgi:nitrate reductase gamma subunit